MSKNPWIRFFPSDWLGGTRGMSAVETGVYITLIMTMYERGEPIPEDHARLARLCGASNSAFKSALETLVSEGKIVRVVAGLWNERVEKEQVYLSEKSEVGFQAAKARWTKTKQKQRPKDADAMRSQCDGNAIPEARSHIEKPTSFSERASARKPNGFVHIRKSTDAALSLIQELKEHEQFGEDRGDKVIDQTVRELPAIAHVRS
ncbi:YdaU family protein [Phyllobacterium chamaecytisi]|uniref:YdaU family protein n=1 Tax=Phyllobacterium chamaecytisi TaxID=2876082 RepID=UPI001CC99C62|nr:YdaU family protein [Phyllobacterium sp. KW56]MBZ9600727.1 YdaU family protein [Phyllobacterium sp. KW56]